MGWGRGGRGRSGNRSGWGRGERSDRGSSPANEERSHYFEATWQEGPETHHHQTSSKFGVLLFSIDADGFLVIFNFILLFVAFFVLLVSAFL